MKWLMIAGGFGMWPLLVFGLVTLGAAILFAWRPQPRKVDVVKALSWATAFSMFSAVTSDFAAVGYKMNTIPEFANDPKPHMIVLMGFAESMAPGILGFTILALVWLVMAVGFRRLGRQTG